MSPEELKSKETYTHGYASAAQGHLSRSAETHAGFFTPHLKPGMRVLDCGCGPGSITLGLAKLVAPGETVGIDIGAPVIDMARNLAAGEENVSFQEASIYEIPFPDSHFDAVFVHKVLEHLAEPHSAMREVFRVMKPGGVVGTRNTDRGAHIWWPPSDLLTRLVTNQEVHWRSNGGNPNFGRQQQSCLRAAVFIDLQTTTGVEMATTGDSTLAADLRSGNTGEWVSRGFITTRELADGTTLQRIIAEAEAREADPDEFIVSAIDFMTIGRKPTS